VSERTTGSSVVRRLARAWDVVRGRDESRAINSITYPNFPGAAGLASMSLVRTANPQEYKPDGAVIRAEGFNKHPVVHACIRVVADIICSVPLIVLREKGNTESRVEDDHPLQRLLNYPGPRLTARQFRARYAVDYLGYGNSFFQLERPGATGLPVGLRPVNAESIQSVWVDGEGDPRRYDYANWAGIIVQAPVEDMLHFRDLDMPRPFQPDVFGFPRGATAIASMAADNEATKYVRQVVTNDGTPTFAVLLADEASQDDAQAMQDRYRARTVDRGKRGTPAFFGAVRDIKPLGFTLSDLEFPDLRRVSREDICAAYGVDPRMIGIASASKDSGLSGAQYVEARARLVQHTIEPMLSAIEDELNHWLAPEFGEVWITYDHDILRDLVEDDEKTSTRVRAEFKDSLRTWEEARRALKLPPLPVPTDAIALSTGTQLVPASTAVLDASTVLQEAPSTDNETPAVFTKQDTAEVKQRTRNLTYAVRALSDAALDGDQIEAIMELLEAVVEGELPAAAVKGVLRLAFPKADPATVAAMLASLSDFEASEEEPEEEPEAPEEAPEEPEEEPEEMAEEVEDQRPWWVHVPPEERPWWVPMYENGTLATEPRYQAWKRAMDELDGEESVYYTAARNQFAADAQAVAMLFAQYVKEAADATEGRRKAMLDEISRRIDTNYGKKGEYYRAWKAAYEALVGETYMMGARQGAGLNFNFTLQSPEVLRAIDTRVSKLAEFVGEDTAKQVTAAIRAAEKAGFSVEETARLVQASVYSERLTEVRAMRIARTEAAGAMSQGSWDQAMELGIYKSKEWLSFDDRKTRDSHRRYGNTNIKPMDYKYGQMLYPLDSMGGASEVINCRCTLVYYTEEAPAQPEVTP